jgi:hypothetical protein
MRDVDGAGCIALLQRVRKTDHFRTGRINAFLQCAQKLSIRGLIRPQRKDSIGLEEVTQSAQPFRKIEGRMIRMKVGPGRMVYIDQHGMIGAAWKVLRGSHRSNIGQCEEIALNDRATRV